MLDKYHEWWKQLLDMMIIFTHMNYSVRIMLLVKANSSLFSYFRFPCLGNKLKLAASLFVWNWLSWQKVSDEKIQILILILILWRGTLSKIWWWWPSWCPSECRRPSSQDGRTIAIGTFVKPELLHLRFADGFLKHDFQGLESITLIAQNSEVWRHLPR